MAEQRQCPTCGSPDPRRHPAVQSEGEVQICRDPWHSPTADQIEGRECTASPRDLAIARAAIDAAANAASDKMTDYYCENCKGGSETDMLAAIRSLDPAEIVRGVK